MLKDMIAPVQAWLLSRGQCVGCGMKLELGKHQDRKDKLHQIHCKCGRVFLHDPSTRNYRRALMSEIES